MIETAGSRIMDFDGRIEAVQEARTSLLGKKLSHRKYGTGEITEVLDADYDPNADGASIVVRLSFSGTGQKLMELSDETCGRGVYGSLEGSGVLEALSKVGSAYRKRYEELARQEEAERLAAEALRRRLSADRLKDDAVKRVQKASPLPKDRQVYDFYYALGWLLGGHMTLFKALMPDYLVNAFERRFGLKVPLNPHPASSDKELGDGTAGWSVRNSEIKGPAGWINQWWLSFSTFFKAEDDSDVPEFFQEKTLANKNKRQYSDLKFGSTLVEEYGFVPGTLQDQDIAKIESKIPNEWFKAYLDGFKAK